MNWFFRALNFHHSEMPTLFLTNDYHFSNIPISNDSSIIFLHRSLDFIWRHSFVHHQIQLNGLDLFIRNSPKIPESPKNTLPNSFY